VSERHRGRTFKSFTSRGRTITRPALSKPCSELVGGKGRRQEEGIV
jgi:hypothetical protein